MEWKRQVNTRDNFKCLTCGSDKNLHTHHIIPWEKDESLRFEVSNGETLCNSCHIRKERQQDGLKPPQNEKTRFQKGQKPWNTETKGKIVAWNKGIKLRPDQINGQATQFKKGQIPWSKGRKGLRLSPETEFKKGVSISPETQFKKGQTPWNKGVKLAKDKIKGKETQFKKCQIPWNKGKPFSEETRQKMRDAKKRNKNEPIRIS